MDKDREAILKELGDVENVMDAILKTALHDVEKGQDAAHAYVDKIADSGVLRRETVYMILVDLLIAAWDNRESQGQWTTEMPTEKGWYWFREYPDAEDIYPIKAIIQEGCPLLMCPEVLMKGLTFILREEFGEMYPEGEYCPIPNPPVESLKAERPKGSDDGQKN